MYKGNLTIDDWERVKRSPTVEERLMPHKTKLWDVSDLFCLILVE